MNRFFPFFLYTKQNIKTSLVIQRNTQRYAELVRSDRYRFIDIYRYMSINGNLKIVKASGRLYVYTFFVPSVHYFFPSANIIHMTESCTFATTGPGATSSSTDTSYPVKLFISLECLLYLEHQ